jgi:hypothetical protein
MDTFTYLALLAVVGVGTFVFVFVILPRLIAPQTQDPPK